MNSWYNNKLIFLGIIFIALLSFMVFSGDNEEVDNVDVIQQEENVLPEDGKEPTSPKPKKPKEGKRGKKNSTFDENEAKKERYKKFIFFEVAVIFFLILIIVILVVIFNFCKKKIDEDEEKTTEKIFYLLKGEENHFKDHKNLVNPAGGNNDNNILIDEEQQKKNEEEQKKIAAEQEEMEKMLKEQQQKKNEELQKQNELNDFKANVSLTIKASGDKIIIYHYDAESVGDFTDYKKSEEEKNKGIVELLKKSFDLEKNYYGSLIKEFNEQKEKLEKEIEDEANIDNQLNEIENQEKLNNLNTIKNNINCVITLSNFINNFLNENDLDLFLQKVVSEIRQTLKILSLDGYDVDNNKLKIGFFKNEIPATYDFLGGFKPEGDPNNIDNNNINNIVGDGAVKKRKQLIFNCFEIGNDNNGTGVIANDSDIKDEAFFKCQKVQVIDQDNVDVWDSISNNSYKEYILKSLQKFGIMFNRFSLLSNSEVCPLKTLLSILNITRSIVFELNRINEVCSFKNSAGNVSDYISNSYNNFFNNNNII